MTTSMLSTPHKREIFNTVSHLVGAVGAVVALIVLLDMASDSGSIRKVVAFSIYGGSMVLLYASSTLYHWLWGRAKAFFKRMDYIAIFFLIAGTYTPFALVTIGGPWGWGVLGVIWALALVGGAVYAVKGDRAKKLAFGMYIAMGWLGLAIAGPVSKAIPAPGLALIVAGGLLYTGGVALLGSKVKRSHEIWHILVLKASACHFMTMALYVA